MRLGLHSHAGQSSAVGYFWKETWSQVRSVLQLRLPLEGGLVTKVATIPTTPEWSFVLERPLSLHGCSTLACYVYVSG